MSPKVIRHVGGMLTTPTEKYGTSRCSHTNCNLPPGSHTDHPYESIDAQAALEQPNRLVSALKKLGIGAYVAVVHRIDAEENPVDWQDDRGSVEIKPDTVRTDWLNGVLAGDAVDQSL